LIALDIANQHLGIEAVAVINEQMVPGIFSPIIGKDTKLPAIRTEPFTTVRDNQEAMEIWCFEGGHPIARENTLISENPIIVHNLPPKPAGEVSIDITFNYDVSQILNVEVCVKDTGEKVYGEYHIHSGGMTNEEIEVSRVKLDKQWEASEIAGQYSAIIQRAEQCLANEEGCNSADKITAATQRLKDAIIAVDKAAAEDADISLTEILFDLEL